MAYCVMNPPICLEYMNLLAYMKLKDDKEELVGFKTLTRKFVCGLQNACF